MTGLIGDDRTVNRASYAAVSPRLLATSPAGMVSAGA
jgi:hypothetical protein